MMYFGVCDALDVCLMRYNKAQTTDLIWTECSKLIKMHFLCC